MDMNILWFLFVLNCWYKNNSTASKHIHNNNDLKKSNLIFTNFMMEDSFYTVDPDHNHKNFNLAKKRTETDIDEAYFYQH